MSDSAPQLESMGSLTMKSQLQITGKSFTKVQYLISLPLILKTIILVSGEMVHRLRALAAVPVDPGLVSNTRVIRGASQPQLQRT